MAVNLTDIQREIRRFSEELIQRQEPDGTWRFCFENGITLDACIIILLRTLNQDREELIRQLHDRILAAQQPEGCWRWYHDDGEGHLSATVEAYYALLFSGYSRPEDEPLQRAKRYILERGGISQASSLLTKAILAATGQRAWPSSLSLIPIEILLLPESFPLNLYDFSGYSRVHLVPLLILAERNFRARSTRTPDLSELFVESQSVDDDRLIPSRESREPLEQIQSALGHLIGTPRRIRQAAVNKAEHYLLERIESDGTLYTYASCTVLMVFALLALGYEPQHPVIQHAVEGLSNMKFTVDGSGFGESGFDYVTIQNSPSTVWDTALISYALQEAGVPSSHSAVRRAAAYLRDRQHQRPGDWQIHNPGILPGGWGFSETNTFVPDVDDTTAALRALYPMHADDPATLDAWNRGLNWVWSMQNNNGGWPAFEKNTNKEMLTWLAIEGAKSAATDPSEADLTGRTLEYLGNFAKLGVRHDWVARGADWLLSHQQEDGSWYGRWGICYIYGTWAALTGFMAVGMPADHPAIVKGADWLGSIQNADGGWGESCRSDQVRRYVPLRASTSSQTAWALDALIAVHAQPTPEIERGVARLLDLLHEKGWPSTYPTGAGLPGYFYTHYHSYRYIWPLLALAHYVNKYGDGAP
ncbi:MAG: squalene--hopene cyclase [Paenibacillaceae bacterium]|uniref:Squalene--hopene cyclase n=1 Tax=Paenibacillus mellifer TaxID=2937794 RepID=A0A9X1Y2S0_9BACL|nr:squalene--hopene cyclase [Paenibacillus mellifer]MBW4838737.1 squalene--hopene cyclase [Paenibacillaceae bacterium]MCK8489849.1 squalene--hopene cyclase [Paenibacillus mellifer]